MGRRHKHNASRRPSPGHSPCPPSSAGYVLEWSSHSRRRHSLGSPEQLRTELLAGECLGLSRILVVRCLDGDTVETLRTVADVEPGFLEAHQYERTYRPRGRARGVKWWSWVYPAMEEGRVEAQGRCGITICRASLWLASQIPILLITNPLSNPSSENIKSKSDKNTNSAPRLQRLDATTRRSALQSSGRYGSVGAYRSTDRTAEADSGSALEDDLWDVLRGEDRVEDVLGELVYEQWVEFLGGVTIGVDGGRVQEYVLWAGMMALELNLDESKYLSRHGRGVDTVDIGTWMDLIQRIRMRIDLRKTVSATNATSYNESPSSMPKKDINERSLDRIAYLGGILLPVTVVAGVLSIEGDYGPEGNNFWVFWIASLAASIIALLVIYVDQVGSLEVWMEVVGSLEGADEEMEDGQDGDDVVVQEGGLAQRWGDGEERVRMWRRRQLGWGGAVKKISGYYRWRGMDGLVYQRPAGRARMRAFMATRGA